MISPRKRSRLSDTPMENPAAAIKAKRSWRNALTQQKAGDLPFMNTFVTNEHRLQNPAVTIHVWDNGHNLEKKLGGFTECHLFKDSKGLEFLIPKIDFKNMNSFLNPIKDVRVGDSLKQKNYTFLLTEFVDSFKKKNREHILNMISLEFSNEDTKLTKEFKTLRFVRENGMVNQLETALEKVTEDMERKWKATKSKIEKIQCERNLANIKKMQTEMPRYQKFLLVSMAGSFTDIHVDFSATSVYYHVRKGRKIFYVAPPTERNLRIYESAEKMENEGRWLGDLLWEQWQRIEILEGQTAMIPAGWIHFVYTPIDSIVVGGNFLLERHLEIQFRMTKLEEECVQKNRKIDRSNMFQGFYPLMWAYIMHVFLPNLSVNPRILSGDSRIKSMEIFLKEMDPKENIDKDWYTQEEREQILNDLKKAMAKVPTTLRTAASSESVTTDEPRAKRARKLFVSSPSSSLFF